MISATNNGTMSNGTTTANTMKRGLVKMILSGDSVVIQGPATNGPPKELTVSFANVAAPRLAKRPTDNSAGTSDEPYAWEAREFLRRRYVNKQVVFVRDYVTPSGREHGRLYFGGTSISDAENIAELGVREGWLEVRQGKQVDEQVQKLLDAQEEAKAAKKGRWAGDSNNHIRDIKWQFDDPKQLIEQYKNTPIDAVVEQVRDGNTVRCFLLPTFEYVTVVFSGVKACCSFCKTIDPEFQAPSPSTRDGRSEEYGDEAKFFVETRLLQREVKVTLEDVSGQNFIGSVIHPRGNIAEFLLKEGLAKCVEWSLSKVSGGPQSLREAERYAKQTKLRLWKTFAGNSMATADKKTFGARVIEAIRLSSKKDNGEELKIFLSSIRPPRREGAGESGAGARQFRPLYDVPHMFAAREFIRKRVIGKRVEVSIDYLQPKSDQFPEKLCCSVSFNGQNLAEQLVSNGLATVVRHRQDDEQRSSHYDDLVAAQSAAEQSKKGLHGDADTKSSTVRVQELQNDLARSKQFLPYLQRSNRPEGIVEFVGSGSRMRIYVPKETCVITFLLGSITCPRGTKIVAGKVQQTGDPIAEEALKFTRSQVLQHEVQIEVESVDKTGGFIGNLFIKPEGSSSFSVNLSELLLAQGLAQVHFSADRSRYYNQFVAAEETAKKGRLGLWKDYVEEGKDGAGEQAANDLSDRKLNLKKVLVSEVQKGLQFAVQNYSDGPTIEKLMNDLQREMKNHEQASYNPRRGEVCACMFKEVNLWHRARVEGIKAGRADVFYIDFGNRENVDANLLASLPTTLVSQPPLCREYKLALVQVPNDKDFADETDNAFREICMSAPYLELNVEYKAGNIEAATLYYPNEQEEKPVDVGKTLIADGLALAEVRREPRFKSLVLEYQEAEKNARRERLNLWRYGDFTGVDV
ncbi:Nuclease domain-containing protein [Aphelenchoides besseyi]|nr:Nuclease domain-containing protein [Aphelenchoides besseyi]